MIFEAPAQFCAGAFLWRHDCGSVFFPRVRANRRNFFSGVRCKTDALIFAQTMGACTQKRDLLHRIQCGEYRANFTSEVGLCVIVIRTAVAAAPPAATIRAVANAAIHAETAASERFRMPSATCLRWTYGRVAVVAVAVVTATAAAVATIRITAVTAVTAAAAAIPAVAECLSERRTFGCAVF